MGRILTSAKRFPPFYAPIHPAWLRCSSVNSPAIRPPRACHTDHGAAKAIAGSQTLCPINVHRCCSCTRDQSRSPACWSFMPFRVYILGTCERLHAEESAKKWDASERLQKISRYDKFSLYSTLFTLKELQ